MAITRKPLYYVWRDIYRRCNNKNRKDYKNYGGRGIKCLWTSYNEFISDMLPIYKNGLEIDRIDNNGNYCKENCRWITKTENARNKRNNRVFSFRGKSLILSQWSEITKIKRSTLAQRFYVYKWSIKDCLTTK